MSLEEQTSSQGHFIPAQLRPAVGVDGNLEAPLEPGTSKDELRRQARAAMAEMERVQLGVEDEERLAPEMWQTIFVRSPDVNSTVLDKEAVLLNLENGVYYTLNPVGTTIWELMTGERTLAEILSALCERYDVSEGNARRDLVALVTRLRREGLIQVRR